MRLKWISCEVFTREVEAVAARSPHQIEVAYLSKGLHNIGCVGMRARIQEVVDRVPEGFDAILLGYGLCNNGLAGVQARAIPLVIPRAHDCIAVLLGSRARYQQEFDRNPGTYYRSTGWMEHETNPDDLDQLSIARHHSMDASFEDLVARYGEDNARYLWQELVNHTRHYSRLGFIEMGVEPNGSFEQQARREASGRGWAFERIKGDLALLQNLVNGEWSEEDFLKIEPGYQIGVAYDTQIVFAEAVAPDR